jgi:hypothetical protein
MWMARKKSGALKPEVSGRAKANGPLLLVALERLLDFHSSTGRDNPRQVEPIRLPEVVRPWLRAYSKDSSESSRSVDIGVPRTGTVRPQPPFARRRLLSDVHSCGIATLGNAQVQAVQAKHLAALRRPLFSPHLAVDGQPHCDVTNPALQGAGAYPPSSGCSPPRSVLLRRWADLLVQAQAAVWTLAETLDLLKRAGSCPLISGALYHSQDGPIPEGSETR